MHMNNLILTANNQRKRLHELPHLFHCSIIGTCFTIEEIRKLVRRCRFDLKGYSDYEVHVFVVNYAKEEGHILCKRLNKMLNKKFARFIQEYADLTQDQLLAAWKQALASGEIPGPFWTLMTHPNAEGSLVHIVYEDVHMLSHLLGASNRADLQRLSHLEEQTDEWQENLKYWRKEAQHRKQQRLESNSEITKLREMVAQQQSKIEVLSQQITTLESEEKMQRLQQKFELVEKALRKTENEKVYLECQLAKTEQGFEILKTRNEHLEKSVRELEEENNFLEQFLTQFTVSDCDGCRHNKEQYNLQGNCILYVGGRYNLVSHYRSLVEDHNGAFLHHDGGLERHEKELGQVMGRVDVVVCPTDCVSHNAFFIVKKHCKKYGKPCLMLRSSGLSSLNQAIAHICDREFTDAKKVILK